MKALRSFSVRTRLPDALAPLERVAMNLRWSWDNRTRELYRWIDGDAWEATRHDPLRTIALAQRGKLDEYTGDPGFLREIGDRDGDLRRYLTEPRWFQYGRKGFTSPLDLVAYFSPEFGISEALPQYSGGLGVLAGDHLKAASDLGVPLVGIGLFYQHGYFRQSLNLEGWQVEKFPTLDPYGLALTLCEGVRVQVDLAGDICHAQVWRADVGRTALYMLDTDVEENSVRNRGVTDRLYGGDVEHRLRQEMVLGIAGVRALDALGLKAQVFHTNEGHAGFLGLERIRKLVHDGLTFDEAIEATRAGALFTTHTPVPAGIDRFPAELMERYFAGFATECGVTFERLMKLGQRADEPDETRFNMAVMGLRLAARSNGVAALHGAVSREMFQGLWPDVPVDEVPITSVTNGVHAPTWISPELTDLFGRYVGRTWDGAGDEDWAKVRTIRDDELWRVREIGRERLVIFVRERLRDARLAQGLSRSDVAWCDDVLDAKALTIGFARRFATYKRATLLLSQPERLKALLLSTDRPVQFVFAGKAHPADDLGKALIQRIQQFANELGVRHRFVFLEDYDIAVARALYQGADVWLNTPRRPQEACGTSGMKSALNGGLNCSIMDGWWDEWFDGENGWAIGSADIEHDLAKRDEIEANSLFDLLEHQIVPLFYNRIDGPTPTRWVAKVKHNFASLGPRVTASRMVREYTERLYEPAAASGTRALAGGAAKARELAEWKRRVLEAWPTVRIASVETDTSTADLGADRAVTAWVQLGTLSEQDVDVQLLHGLVGQGDELTSPERQSMASTGTAEDGAARYEARFSCVLAGRYGFTVRVVPRHESLVDALELGRVTWA